MRLVILALALALAGCVGSAPTSRPSFVAVVRSPAPESAEVSQPPLATPRPTRPTTPRPAQSVVVDPVEREAREHCPDGVESFYEGCVAAWTGLVFGFPDTRLVLCVWPDGHSLIAEPGTEGAGREVGDACSNSWGRGTLTRIVNEGT